MEESFLHAIINCTQISLDTQCEAVACRINLSHGQILIVLTIYRPHKSDIRYMQNICKGIESLCIEYENAVLWVTGDFNLPKILTGV